MASIIIPRPSIIQSPFTRYTTGSDYIRASSASEVLGYRLSAAEQSFIVRYSAALGVDLNTARDDFFLGLYPQYGGPAPDYSLFSGNDRIYGRGGNDYVVDLAGDNFVVTEEGNDRILLGFGNDRIYDQGGNNFITDYGGNNTITTRDGNDRITTGAGNDNINAFDGKNIINAGNGKNSVRGGDNADLVRVGLGNDFVEVLTTGLVTDAAGNLVRDAAGKPIDQTVSVNLPGFTSLTDFGNIVIDQGGSDNIRASGNSRNDFPGFPDREFNGDDAVISDFAFLSTEDATLLGKDTIEVGGGDNFVLDFGGRTTVRTLEGADQIYTSFGVASDDEIFAGAGADEIYPGAGSDRVHGGPGGDLIDLGNDGGADTLVYGVGDQTFRLDDTDVVFGFEGLGRDKIDVSGLDLRSGNLLLTGLAPGTVGDASAPDLLVWWDANGDGKGDFFTTILADFDSSRLTLDSFIFADPLAIA